MACSCKNLLFIITRVCECVSASVCVNACPLADWRVAGKERVLGPMLNFLRYQNIPLILPIQTRNYVGVQNSPTRYLKTRMTVA